MKTLKTLIIMTFVLGIAVSAQAIKVHQRLFMMTNTIEAAQSVGLVETNVNDLTTAVTDGTVAIDTEGVMYIHHTGVWHRIAGGGDLSSATNQVLIDAKAYTDLATNGVGITWDGRWVNQSGDTMSGSLDMGNNDISNVNYLAVKDLYAETEHVIDIVVSNAAYVTTNLTVDGILNMSGYNITNLAPATEGHMAVNYDQLTNQIGDVQGDLSAATNQVLIEANNYTDSATNSVLNTSINYTDSATNAVYNQSVNYTDNATNGLMNDADARFVNEAGDDMTGILGMGNNTITNLAPATRGDMAVNYDQLTNATFQSEQDLIAATNQVLIDSKAYTDSATNAVGETWDDRWVNQSGDSMSGSLDMSNNDISNVNYLAVKDLYAETEHVIDIVVSNAAYVTTNLTVDGILNMSGYNITNLAPATEGHMAVNYDQLTNQIGDVQGDLSAATNQVLIEANNYTDSATNSVLNTSINYTDAATNSVLNTAINYADSATNAVYNQSVSYTDNATNGLMTDADARFVNEAGDNMTGILGMGGNRITNVANAINPQDAVTKAQLDAATNALAGNVTLQKAYENGNSISTSLGEGDVVISGTEGLHVSASGGIGVTGGGDVQVLNSGNVYVNGGDVQLVNGGDVEVDGANGGQINVDGATGNESIRLNSSGKMVIYSGGQLALEFE